MHYHHILVKGRQTVEIDGNNTGSVCTNRLLHFKAKLALFLDLMILIK